MVDPNVYALSIELQLEAATAFETLDDFSDKIVDVENELLEVGQKAIGQIEVLIGTLDTGITRVMAQIRDIQNETGQLTSTYKKTGVSTDTIGDSLQDQVKQIQKQIKLEEELVDIAKEIEEFGVSELERIKDYNKQMNQLVETINIKNKGHEKELGLVEDEYGRARSLHEQWQQNGKEVNNNYRRYVAITDVLRQIVGLIQDIDKETENFITTNYRYYGSQSAIVQQVRQLSLEQGLFYENALETYKLLADLRIPRDEILKYTKAISMASRFTGVGSQVLVEYVQRMRQVGITVNGVERNMVFMSEAMRKLGLDSDDLSKSLQSTSVSAFMLETIFKGPDQAIKYEQLKLVMAGLAKQMGLATDVADKFMNTLLDPIERAKFSQFTGVAINSVDDMRKAMVKAGKQIAPYVERLEQAREAGNADLSSELQMEIQNLANVYFGGSEAALFMAANLEKTAKKMNLNLENAVDLEKALAAVRKEIEDPYAEANNTLTAQLNILYDRFSNLIKEALQPLADKLRDILKILNHYIDIVIPKIVKMWHMFWEALDQIPFLTKLLHMLGDGSIILGIITVGLIALVAALAMLPPVAIMAGIGLYGFFRGLGMGLQALGNSVRQVMVPLAVLSGAFLVASVGAFLLAKAVAIVARQGTAAIPAILGLVAAIAAVGLILVGLGMLAQGPVILGMAVVAAAFIAVSVAAVIMAGALWIGAQAFDVFVSSMERFAKLDLINASIQLGVFAVTLNLAAAGLMAAAIILLPASLMLTASVIALQASATIFSLAVTGIMAGATMLELGATTLLNAGMNLTKAVWDLIPSSALLFTASVTLGLAMAVLIPAAAGLVAAGAMMWLGSVALSSAVGLLKSATDIISSIAIPMFVGATLMLAAGTMMAAAGAVMMVAGVSLTAGAAAIGLGIIAFAIAAGSVAAVGALFYAGAWGIFDGSQKLAQSSIILGQAIKSIILSMSGLGEFVSVVGDKFIPAVRALESGADILEEVGLKFAAILPNIGALHMGIAMLAAAFTQLEVLHPQQLAMIIDSGLQTIPKIDLFASQLTLAANKLDVATKLFQQPADTLAMAMGHMNAAFSDFEIHNLALESKVSAVGGKLEEYATLIESAAQRIETAVALKAIPALRAAEEAGLDDVVRSEAITTVQVMHEREGDVTNRSDELATSAVARLDRLVELVEPIMGNGDAVKVIQTLLEQYLPGIADSETKTLSNQMNKWA